MSLGRRRFASLAVPLLAAACASPDPVYYTVATRPGATFPSGPKIVVLKDIGLASYLDRREIVRSSEGYKLDVMSNDWWGESLGGMLGRVLVVELSQRLPFVIRQVTAKLQSERPQSPAFFQLTQVF